MGKASHSVARDAFMPFLDIMAGEKQKRFERQRFLFIEYIYIYKICIGVSFGLGLLYIQVRVSLVVDCVK